MSCSALDLEFQSHAQQLFKVSDLPAAAAKTKENFGIGIRFKYLSTVQVALLARHQVCPAPVGGGRRLIAKSASNTASPDSDLTFMRCASKSSCRGCANTKR